MKRIFTRSLITAATLIIAVSALLAGASSAAAYSQVVAGDQWGWLEAEFLPGEAPGVYEKRLDTAAYGHHTAAMMWTASIGDVVWMPYGVRNVYVRVRADDCEGPANMRLEVYRYDGTWRALANSVQDVTNSTYAWKRVAATGAYGWYYVRVSFTNDHYKPPCDRNLYVDEFAFQWNF